MKGNFARINDILSNNELVQIPRICFENRPNFFPYCRFLKKRSVNDFIFASYMLLYPITTQNCRKPHSYMIFHSELFQKHSVRQKTAKTR